MKTLQYLALMIGSVLATSAAHAKPTKPAFYAYRLDIAQAALRGINNSGQIVGYSVLGGGYVAFITGPKGKGITFIPGFNGAHSFPAGINASGQVAGDSDGEAFITGPNGQGITRITMPVADYHDARASGINDQGQVVGTYYTARPDGTVDWHAFLTGPNGKNARQIEGFNPARTSAEAINNLGQVAGISQFEDGAPETPFVTGPQGITPVDIGKGGAAYVSIRALNDAGQVGGQVILPSGKYAGDASHSFVADPGQPLEIKKNFGGSDGYVASINAHGDYAGSAQSTYDKGRAYVAVRHGKPTDLNALIVNLPKSSILRSSAGINDARQLAVSGIDGPYIVCPTEDCK